MTRRKHKNSYILVIGAAMIFLNLTIYLPHVHLFPFPAYILDLGILTIVLLIYLKRRFPFPFSNPVILWIIYYFAISSIYFSFSGAGDREWKYLKLVIFMAFVLLAQIMLFNLDDKRLTTVRKTMVLLAPIAAITLGIDYFIPHTFELGIESDTYTVGRAASIYLNANIAGGAMVVFLIFGIDIVPKRYRILFIMIIFLGIFFTMSRSNIMIMMITLFVMFLQKKLYGSHLVVSLVAIMLFFTWLSISGFDMLSDKYDLQVTDNMRSRVNFFSDKKHSDTSDMDERKHVLRAALEMFMDKPLLGNGYVSTRIWKYRVSPHNTFAMLWADYGLVGMSIIPLLFFLSTFYIFIYADKESRQMAILVILYFTFSSFFSHNMLEQPFQLATLMALSVVGYKAKMSTKKRVHD
jgi:hypothetical protein